jgi:hypothetical protein
MALRGLDRAMAEAGSREVPPAFVVHDEERQQKKSSNCPTKLFIGGISRHTTTKQLRDHFSQYGEVLDCIAMRGGDGRPRGFGYVTLDSPSAAHQCLCEPQLIDNRIVDMKLAVPESVASSKSGFGKQTGLAENVLPNYSYGAWPGAGPLDRQSWWSHCPQMHSGAYEQALDCLQILSQTRDSLSLSAGAPEFVPLSEQTTPEAKISQSTPSPVKKRVTPSSEKGGRKRAPLGEITNSIANVFGVDDLLKPFKSPVNKSMGVGHLSMQSSDKSESPAMDLDGIAIETHHMGVRLDRDFLDEVQYPNEDSRKYNMLLSPPTSSDEGEENSFANSCNNGRPSEQLCDTSSSENSPAAKEEHVADELPSVGSALHLSGECKRCNSFAKGRCQNGKNCSFCHFPHEVRKPTRQEKRDRRESKLQGRPQDIGNDASEEDSTSRPHMLSCTHPLLNYLCTDSLQTSLYGCDHDNDATSDETYAYSIFPGLPPVRAMKLPAPLALPTMETLGRASPALPPGLVTAPRGLFSAKDQTTSDLSALGSSTLLSTAPPSSSIPPSTTGSMSSTFLSTTPSLTMPPSVAEVQTKTVVMSTAGTQTEEDYNCPTCDLHPKKGSGLYQQAAEDDCNTKDTRWTREELLRLRSVACRTQTSTVTLCHAKSIDRATA